MARRPLEKETPRRFRFKLASEVIAELKKVTWPTRREAIRLTLLVLSISVAVGLTLGALDYGLTQMAKTMFPGK